MLIETSRYSTIVHIFFLIAFVSIVNGGDVDRVTEVEKITGAGSTSVPRNIIVSVTNSTIQLPNDQSVLSAFVIPSIGDYRYTWRLISPLQVEDVGIIEGLNEPQVRLSKLKSGNYTFQVTVTETDATGIVAMGNATGSLIVRPPIKTNKPPVAIVQPIASTVQLPNKDTFLDGSHSTDDDRIVRYEWTGVKVPIGYGSVSVSNASILQLKDLIPGLYRVNLTVTDSSNATDTTTATLTVLKEIDYPPTANAGADIVLNLPANEVTLDGNGSVDDKGVVEWQWIRLDDGGNAIDMNGASTAHLHLSKLTVGLYKFQLQVTDRSGQTAKDEINVLVKPENNSPPVARVGEELRVVLPATEAIILDGSASTDDVAIETWLWRLESGPRNLTIDGANSSRATIEKIVPGRFNFSLTVWDAKNESSTAFKIVEAVQVIIIPPKADAGGDKIVTLPADVVELDGRQSADDGEIVAYHWERLPLSLACGDILTGSDNSSILKLLALEAGRYLFKLTVVDNQGAMASDVASVIVKPPVDQFDHLQAVLNYNVGDFTLKHRLSFYKSMENAFGEAIELRHIQLEKTADRRPVLVFVAYRQGRRLPGLKVASRLRQRLRSDETLALAVESLETVVCQNVCSGHGRCDQRTKKCLCEAFWMENWLRRFGDDESNCDWSILYVIIISVALLVIGTVFLWFAICLIANYGPSSTTATTFHKGRKNRLSPSEASSTLGCSTSGGGGRYRRPNKSRYTLVGDGSDLVELLPNGHVNI